MNQSRFGWISVTLLVENASEIGITVNCWFVGELLDFAGKLLVFSGAKKPGFFPGTDVPSSGQ